ncbi:MAG: hypothetical protein HY023_06115 [Chloroflexi bacterium]|nr:hypothetical protein [Chloroflexota bacterium]
MKVIMPEPQVPEGATVSFKVEVSAALNVTTYIARRRVNHFLMMTVGNMLHAGAPELLIDQKMKWRVPILYSLPGIGLLGKVGETLVDVSTGDVSFNELTTTESIERHVEALYRSSPLSAGESV